MNGAKGGYLKELWDSENTIKSTLVKFLEKTHNQWVLLSKKHKLKSKFIIGFCNEPVIGLKCTVSWISQETKWYCLIQSDANQCHTKEALWLFPLWMMSQQAWWLAMVLYCWNPDSVQPLFLMPVFKGIFPY